jgi:hypothetical protein
MLTVLECKELTLALLPALGTNTQSAYILMNPPKTLTSLVMQRIEVFFVLRMFHAAVQSTSTLWPSWAMDQRCVCMAMR